MSLEELICTSGKLPADIGVPVLRNAGGVYNHRFYFDGMSTPSGSRPFGILAGAVNQSFTNFDRFKETLSAAALSIFGSGYAWLASDRAGFGSSPLQTRKRRCPAGSAQFSTLMSGNTLIT